MSGSHPVRRTPARPPRSGSGSPAHFHFLLLDRFTLLSFSCAVECLRLANRIAGRQLYSWSLIGENGSETTCSLGIGIRLDGGLGETARGDTIMVCGGLDIDRASSRQVLGWLRRESRRGVRIGGLCTAAHTLALAGLLDGRRATIHWENRDSFAETFDEVRLSRAVFTIDGDRMTAAGGTASIDLMLNLIAGDHGPELAGAVADQQLYSAIRTDQDTQRLSVPARIGVRHPRLARVIEMMENSIEEPVSPSALAAAVGMSTRQLERLFRRYLDRSPKRYYMELRLQKARNLLLQTDMSVINVALACGFASPSHFSKCYRAHYNTTPYRERGAHARRLPV